MLKQNRISTRQLTVIAMLAAISYLLAFLEISLPIFPDFLKVNISALPSLIGAFIFGPVTGVIISLIKNGLRLFTTQTGGVGELADLLIESSIAITAGLIYRYNKSRKGAFIGCTFAIVAMMIVGGLANKFLLIPVYSKFMPLDKIIELSAKANPLITDVNSYILYGVLPFNLFKGVVITAVTLAVYKKLSGFIKKRV